MSAHGIGQASAARVGMVALIVAEASLFAVFVVAYLYDLGKSLSGPSPRDVLSVPVVGTVCLLSSSVTVVLAVRALARGAVRRCGAWLLATVVRDVRRTAPEAAPAPLEESAAPAPSTLPETPAPPRTVLVP